MADIIIDAAIVGAAGGWLAYAIAPVVIAFRVGVKTGRIIARR